MGSRKRTRRILNSAAVAVAGSGGVGYALSSYSERESPWRNATAATAGTGWSRTPGSARTAEGRFRGALPHPRPRRTRRRRNFRRRHLRQRHLRHRGHTSPARRCEAAPCGTGEWGRKTGPGGRCWRSRGFCSSWLSGRPCRGGCRKPSGSCPSSRWWCWSRSGYPTSPSPAAAEQPFAQPSSTGRWWCWRRSQLSCFSSPIPHPLSSRARRVSGQSASYSRDDGQTSFREYKSTRTALPCPAYRGWHAAVDMVESLGVVVALGEDGSLGIHVEGEHGYRGGAPTPVSGGRQTICVLTTPRLSSCPRWAARPGQRVRPPPRAQGTLLW